MSKKKKGVSEPRFPFLHKSFLWWILLGAVILFVGILRLNLIDLPLDRDEGTYSYLGYMLRHGGEMYVDGYEMKPPGLFITYAAVDLFFGHTKSGIHLALLLTNLLSVFLMFLFVRKWFHPFAAWVSAAGFGLLALNPMMSGFASLSEHYLLFFFLLGIWTAIRAMEKSSIPLLLVAGFCGGWSVMIKQNGLFFFLFSAIFFWVMYDHFRKKGGFKRFTALLYYFGGAALSGLICLLVLFWQGAFSDFWYWNVVYPNSEYLATISFAEGKGYFLDYLSRIGGFHELLWILSGAGILLFAALRMKWKEILLVLSFLFLSFLSIVPGLRFYGHYWICLLPILSLGLGFLFHYIRLGLDKLLPIQAGVVIAGLALVVIFGLELDKNGNYYFRSEPLVVMRTVYGENPFFELDQLGSYLKGKMNAEDRLIVFGSEAQCYLYTDRECLHPNIYITFLAKPHRRAGEYQSVFKELLEEDKPEYAILVVHPFSWSITDKDDVTIFNWSYYFATRNYEAIAYADIIPGQRPVFVYDGAARDYTPTSSNYVAVMKLK